MKGRKFSSIEESALAVDVWFVAQGNDFFLAELMKLEQ
jgi:hypothetical protein